MYYKDACALLTLVLSTGSAAADLKVLVAVDPSDRETMVISHVASDPSVDTWAGPAKLDPEKPVIFQCNGPECWKSYKAATVALAKGFKKVYWFRGGFPEWESRGLPVESSLSASAAPTEAIAPVAAAPKGTAAR